MRTDSLSRVIVLLTLRLLTASCDLQAVVAVVVVAASVGEALRQAVQVHEVLPVQTSRQRTVQEHRKLDFTLAYRKHNKADFGLCLLHSPLTGLRHTQ